MMICACPIPGDIAGVCAGAPGAVAAAVRETAKVADCWAPEPALAAVPPA